MQTTRIIGAIFITAIAAGVFTAVLVHAVWFAPETEVTDTSISVPTSTVVAVQSGDKPARLIIPSIGVNANVQDVGIAASGNMAVPNNFTDVAWYKYGPVPGALGSAVMDGHVDNGLSLAGVFKHLSDVKVGDDVYVENQSGQRLHFKVTDIELYPYKSVPTDQIFNPKDTERLNLITCDGSWVQGQRTYDHRLVVYTTLMSS